MNSETVSETGAIGIIAGAGAFPAAVAQRLVQQGRDVFILALEGIADQSIERYPHRWIRIAAFGTLIATARANRCRDLTFIGSLTRPGLLSCLPDFGALALLPQILQAYRGGDDHLLRGIMRLFENQGFRVLGVQELVPELLAPAGIFGRKPATSEEMDDIHHALAALDDLGRYDIGQALVLSRRHIVAVEGAEGTDGLLERVAAMRASGRISWSGQRGILVKAPKRGQDLRIDLPAVGPKTVALAKAAKLSGIAVLAGQTLMLDFDSSRQQADDAGLFFVGFERPT